MARYTKKQGKVDMRGRRGKQKRNVSKYTVRVVPKHNKTRKPSLRIQNPRVVKPDLPSMASISKLNTMSRKSLKKGKYVESLGYRTMALVTLLATYAPTESKFDKGDLGNLGSISGQDNKTILQWYEKLLEAKKQPHKTKTKTKTSKTKKSKTKKSKTKKSKTKKGNSP